MSQEKVWALRVELEQTEVKVKQKVFEKNKTLLSQDLSIIKLKSTLESIRRNAAEIRARIQNCNAI